jgi:hypothetical protein
VEEELTRRLIVDVLHDDLDDGLRALPRLASIHGLHQQLVFAALFAVEKFRGRNLAFTKTTKT